LSTSSTPFTDTAVVRGVLYSNAERPEQRTGALHRAKVSGADATETIAALAMAVQPTPTRVADIGCGRGTTTVRLARQYPAAAIIAVDQSPALLAVVGDRLRAHNHEPQLVTADFHRLPEDLREIDLVVMAFCLYHSPHPQDALAAIARHVNRDGSLIITTKAADSYHEMDEIIAASGLDREATDRPSLYRSFHSDNAETVLRAAGLRLRRRLDQHHTFRFQDTHHLAQYASTCPKYQLAPDAADDLARLADRLENAMPGLGLTTTSTVTYLIADRP
jgi:SAM-dependent methyltransferase